MLQSCYKIKKDSLKKTLFSLQTTALKLSVIMQKKGYFMHHYPAFYHLKIRNFAPEF